jgi:DNA-binding response OmpR family regulator
MTNVLTKPQVLAVDDSLQTLKLLRFLLEDEGYEVIVASNTRRARQILESPSGRIGLMILDVMMPGMDGFDFCQQIRQEGERVPIIFLSAMRDTKSRAAGLKMGADDYVAKPFDPKELLARVAAVLRRTEAAPRMLKSQPVLRMGEVELDAARLKVRTSNGREADLTPTETKLLDCLMRNAGRALARDALINQVWNSAGDASAVEVYIGRLRRKVEPDPSDPRYIKTVRGLGYVFQTA